MIQSGWGRATVVDRYILPSHPSKHPVVSCLASSVEAGLGVHEQGNNETVQTQDFGENENQNHADEQTGLLSSSSHTGITDNTDGKASSKTSQTDGKTRTELNETSVQSHVLLQIVGDEDRDDETVDTNDTSHNDGDNVLHDEVRSENTHGSDTDTGLCGTVSGTQTGEDNGTGATHSTKEGRVDRAVFGDHFGGVVGRTIGTGIKRGLNVKLNNGASITLMDEVDRRGGDRRRRRRWMLGVER
jgi:hypothetical protein